MMTSGGFGKSYLVLDTNQAGWLYCLLMGLVTDTDTQLEFYRGDVEMCKTIAEIIQNGDASGTIVPPTGANGIWLTDARRARMVGH